MIYVATALVYVVLAIWLMKFAGSIQRERTDSTGRWCAQVLRFLSSATLLTAAVFVWMFFSAANS